MERENVRVDTKILNKVRRHVKKTKHSIGGFYDLAVQEKIERDKNPNKAILDAQYAAQSNQYQNH